MEKAIGKVTSAGVDVPVAAFIPPWLQDGNGADPDERSGSFTENRQNWERCPDAG